MEAVGKAEKSDGDHAMWCMRQLEELRLGSG